MIRGQHTAARRRREGKKEKVCQMLHDLRDASRASAFASIPAQTRHPHRGACVERDRAILLGFDAPMTSGCSARRDDARPRIFACFSPRDIEPEDRGSASGRPSECPRLRTRRTLFRTVAPRPPQG